MSLDVEMTSFIRDRYPSVEEEVVQNTMVLYKRKKVFLQDLRHIVNVLAFVVIGMIYLRDASLLHFLSVAFIQYSLSNPYKPLVSGMQENSREVLSKFMLVNILGVNLAFLTIHLIFGVDTGYNEKGKAKSSVNNNYNHGGFILQFIGESYPSSRLEVVLFDLLLVAIQVVYHSLMYVVNDYDILSKNLDRLDGDGYTGNVNLLSIDIIQNMVDVLSFKVVPNSFPITQQDPQVEPRTSMVNQDLLV